MAEYIEREALLDALNDNIVLFESWPHLINGKDCFVRAVKKAPAADVVPVVHGRWIAEEQKVWNLEIPVVIGWCCSVCAEEGYIDFDYCPNCGARMDGDGND